MSKLIAICGGHGGSTPGKETPLIKALGRRIKEHEFNSAVEALLDIELRRCGFRTLIVAPGAYDRPLAERTKAAIQAKADAYISIHYDAFDGKFDGDALDPSGHSIYIYPGDKTSRALANAVYTELRKGTAQKSRGIKEEKFAVLKNTYTKMPAILSENGFMDNEREALLMLNPVFQREVAVEHCKGICAFFGVKYVPEPVVVPKPTPVAVPKTTYHRVVVGSFTLQSHATSHAAKLKKVKVDTFLVPYHVGNLTFYRVVAGSYKNVKDAQAQVVKLKKLGFGAFIAVVKI